MKPVIVSSVLSSLVVLSLSLPASAPGAVTPPPAVSVESLDLQPSQGGAVMALQTTVPVPRFTCTLPPSEPNQVIIDFPDASSRLRKRYVLDGPLVREAQVLKKPEPGVALRIRIVLEEAVLVAVEQAGQGLNFRFQKAAGLQKAAVLQTTGAADSAPPTEYRVGAGDKIEIAVYGHGDLDKVLEVRSDGMINFPLIGDISVLGKTTPQIDDEITQALAKDYVIDPKVSVDVKEYGSQWITVIGEIKNPGRYLLKGNMRLIDLVATAGGLTTFANRRQVQLLRGENGTRKKSVVNLKLIEEGEAADLPLLPGDVVIVPRRAF